MTRLESIVCWKWKPFPGYRCLFTADHVNVLHGMIARHYPKPHRFILVTDDPAGVDPGIEVIPLWSDFADVPSPHGGKNPSCYRRLKMFGPEAEALFGKRFVSIDLDCVVTGDLAPIFDRPEDFVMWGDTNPQPGSHYNGSLILLTAGARPQVWDRFDPSTSPQLALKSRCWGSDQGWISYVLGKGETRWSKADGVYSYRNDLQKAPSLPTNARLVFFHGEHKPWHERVQQRHGWVRERWVRHQPQAVAC